MRPKNSFVCFHVPFAHVETMLRAGRAKGFTCPVIWRNVHGEMCEKDQALYASVMFIGGDSKEVERETITRFHCVRMSERGRLVVERLPEDFRERQALPAHPPWSSLRGSLTPEVGGD